MMLTFKLKACRKNSSYRNGLGNDDDDDDGDDDDDDVSHAARHDVTRRDTVLTWT